MEHPGHIYLRKDEVPKGATEGAIARLAEVHAGEALVKLLESNDDGEMRMAAKWLPEALAEVLIS